MNTIRICIVDDHPIVLMGLKQIVSEESDMSVIGEASNIADLFKILDEKEFDILILDLNLPGRSGFDTIKEIKSIKPDLPILILSMYDEDLYGLRCLREGASGYLKKSSATEELVKAIRIVCSGRKYLSQSLTEKLIDTSIEQKDQSKLSRLSNREMEVLRRIAIGQSIEDIARDMYLSPATIYTYRNRILEKLNLKSNVEITQFAIINKLIDW